VLSVVVAASCITRLAADLNATVPSRLQAMTGRPWFRRL